MKTDINRRPRHPRAMLTLFAGLWASLAAAQGTSKTIIAHRGASGYLPEHTIEAYAFAYAQGADYIEPDLVMTKDARFICQHDVHLDMTTNVEEVLPDRKRDDGHWYAADLTLDEVKRLQVHERLPNRFPVGAASFQVATLEEMIELVQGLNRTTGRDVGIYPELKAPDWHAENGLPMEEALLRVLTRYGYEGPGAKVFIQCFWPGPLMKIRNELGSSLPLIMLISTDERSEPLVTKEAMGCISTFANGIGPAKERIEANPDLVKWAHDAGLVVHPYDYKTDEVPAKYPNVEEEMKYFLYTLNVDGLFVDHPDKAIAVRNSQASAD